jgi:MFS family permease
MSRSIALRILAVSAAVGLFSQALLIGNVFGLNLPLMAGAVLAAAVALRPVGHRIDPLDLWLPVGAIAVTAGIALRADPFLVLLDIGSGCLLLGAAVAAIGGSAVWTVAGILRVTIAARRPAEPHESQRRIRVPAAPVLRGLLIAIPILIVFAALFSSADAVFARLTDQMFGWRIDVGELPFRLAVAFLIAWIAAGLLAVAAGSVGPEAPPAPMPQSLGAAAADPPVAWPAQRPVRLGSIEAATILVAVDVLFGFFVLLQLAYLFGGLDTLAATGLPYAQYARSGFFELVWVAVLAGGLLVTVHGLAMRTRWIVGSGLALAALTAVVLASAFLRLRIYQDAYGWTELRFYVLATIVWLAVGIGVTVVLLARDRMRWLLHGLAISAMATLVAINLVGPARVIAEQNVARLLDPSLVPPDGRTGLDLRYARLLGDDAVPALVTALPALGGEDRAELLAVLAARKADLADASTTGWPSWNLGREGAREALAALPDR